MLWKKLYKKKEKKNCKKKRKKGNDFFSAFNKEILNILQKFVQEIPVSVFYYNKYKKNLE